MEGASGDRFLKGGVDDAERVDHRRRVAAYLALLSSRKAHTVLGRIIEPQRLAFALCRAWFEVVYVPSGRYLDGLRGDVSHEAVRSFETAFDDDELAALERFHRFFELRLERQPAEVLESGRILLDDPWDALVKDAGYLLESLEVDANEVRSRLEDRLSESDLDGIPVDVLIRGGSERDK